MIVPVHAANPGPFTGEGNWTYLIAGRTPVLIDAGAGVEAHLDAVAGHLPEGPVDVLVTHAHADHASGAPAIRARWNRARFSKFPWPERDSRYAVEWRPLAHEDVIPAGDDHLRVIHTPGHAPDHVCFWHEPSRTVFGGDLVVRGGTVFIPASNGGSLADYLQSLRRVLALQPARLLPAHGPAIDDPEAVIRKYLEHRQHRERQVLGALEAGVRQIDAIVEKIYVGLAADLVPMARESVLAHLMKLERESLATRSGEEWHPAS